MEELKAAGGEERTEKCLKPLRRRTFERFASVPLADQSFKHFPVFLVFSWEDPSLTDFPFSPSTQGRGRIERFPGFPSYGWWNEGDSGRLKSGEEESENVQTFGGTYDLRVFSFSPFTLGGNCD